MSLYSLQSKLLTNDDASGFNKHRRKLTKTQHMFGMKSFDTLKSEDFILIKVSAKSLAKTTPTKCGNAVSTWSLRARKGFQYNVSAWGKGHRGGAQQEDWISQFNTESETNFWRNWGVKSHSTLGIYFLQMCSEDNSAAGVESLSFLLVGEAIVHDGWSQSTKYRCYVGKTPHPLIFFLPHTKGVSPRLLLFRGNWN